MRSVLIIGLLLVATNCSSRTKASYSAWGSDAEIACFSGGVLILQGKSDGKVFQEESGSGYSWQDKASGKLLRSNADCIIMN
jgi:hypothetical protein